jgi:hypothetical protein
MSGISDGSAAGDRSEFQLSALTKAFSGALGTINAG